MNARIQSNNAKLYELLLKSCTQEHKAAANPAYKLWHERVMVNFPAVPLNCIKREIFYENGAAHIAKSVRVEVIKFSCIINERARGWVRDEDSVNIFPSKQSALYSGRVLLKLNF